LLNKGDLRFMVFGGEIWEFKYFGWNVEENEVLVWYGDG
jgi:hypothetical protein